MVEQLKSNASPESRFKQFQLFLIFLKLGLTSFGGPIAHIGYFREEFVTRRKWLNEHTFTDLFALCQLLPGPTSSQFGILIGLLRGSYPGAIVAWLGFTLPSATILILFAFGLTELNNTIHAGWLHGLKIVAVAVVANAVWTMGKNLCPDTTRVSFAIVGAIVTSLFPNTLGQVSTIIGGGIMGYLILRQEPAFPHSELSIKISKLIAISSMILFFSLLLLLPLVARLIQSNTLHVFQEFFRVGALVFGGGHIVLPLLQSVVVPSEMVSNSMFLAGYGAAQALPGPLFSFAAYLGAISHLPPNGLLGASICLIAIYLPSFLLIIGLFPFWEKVRRFHGIKRAMLGVNAAIVGLLLSALYNPVWTSAINNTSDFCVVLAMFLLLNFWKFPPWLVVLIGAGIGQTLAAI